ncbi:MAG: hypothetical protein ABIZ34_05570 [Candidatus Limnocylindrales bacterium]
MTTTRSLAMMVAALLVAGCYNFSTPQYRPGDTRQVTEALIAHGVGITASVSGETACNDPGLVGNAVHLSVSTAADPTVLDLYLYTFKSSKWDESKDAVDRCEDEYAPTLPPTMVTKRVDIPTYRAFGAGWSEDLAQRIEAALAQASSEGR